MESSKIIKLLQFLVSQSHLCQLFFFITDTFVLDLIAYLLQDCGNVKLNFPLSSIKALSYFFFTNHPALSIVIKISLYVRFIGVKLKIPYRYITVRLSSYLE